MISERRGGGWRKRRDKEKGANRGAGSTSIISISADPLSEKAEEKAK